MSNCPELSTIIADYGFYPSSNINCEDLITLEGLRTLYNSCFTCGVSWSEGQISLDCKECGDYAMRRPCPRCDGKCESVWQRNLSQTHKNHQAYWEGDCKMSNSASSTTTSSTKLSSSSSMSATSPLVCRTSSGPLSTTTGSSYKLGKNW